MKQDLVNHSRGNVEPYKHLQRNDSIHTLKLRVLWEKIV